MSKEETHEEAKKRISRRVPLVDDTKGALPDLFDENVELLRVRRGRLQERKQKKSPSQGNDFNGAEKEKDAPDASALAAWLPSTMGHLTHNALSLAETEDGRPRKKKGTHRILGNTLPSFFPIWLAFLLSE